MKDDYTYLKHIQDAITKIEKYLSDLSYDSFSCNDLIIDAVMKELEIIGEAANNVSDKFRQDNPEIPWRKIIGIRNVLIHEYFGVNKRIIWETCKEDLKELKKSILSALK